MKNFVILLPALAVLLFGCEKSTTTPEKKPSSATNPDKMPRSSNAMVAEDMPVPSPTTPPTAPVVPVPESDEDRRITMDIQDKLQQDATLSAASQGIQITTKDGTVTLSGQVASEVDKSSIEMAVGSVNGVRQVSNRLIVKS